MTTKSDVRVVKTICNMCGTRCGIDVYVENGEIVKVLGMEEHPFNTMCVKAKAIPELVHSSERLAKPLRKIDGELKEVSWGDALDFIAERLSEVKQRYGAKACVLHFGVPFVSSCTEYVARRFSDLYGTPNYTSGASFCFMARTIGHSLTCGTHIFPHQPGSPRCMVIWGNNPPESRPLQADYIYAMLGRGIKLIVVDPRASALAKKADIHAQIRPGTDCALALSVLNVIINEWLYDRDFVEQWTVGFAQLAEHVKDWSPEKVEAITWVEAETIREMARMYASSKPATVSLGISMDHCTNGIQAIRAITTLIAITGNFDIPGGNTYVPRFRLASLRIPEKVADETSVGADYPLFTRFTLEETVVPVIDQMLTEKPYPIKALLIAGCNPAVTWPNIKKFEQGREKLDLMVVVDIFLTSTAKMADVVLPGTTFLETEDIRTYGVAVSRGGHPIVCKSNRVIKPIGDSMEDWKIWVELGKKIGYGEYFPWKDTDELFEELLKSTNVTLDQLKQKPGGIRYAEREFQKYLRDGFNTLSKKVEIFSETLKEHGYDGLPTFHEPAESPVSRSDLVDKYPLMFLSGPRTIFYHHSQHRNLPTLRKFMPESLLEIHPQTASSFGVADGDMVTVESIRGSIKIKAKLTEDVHPKVVSMQHGWSDTVANYLTDDEERDPISGYPGFRSVLCRVTKA
ncbi:molybdopterin-dependent oxidoreductase [Chloroflexota bacterium]